MLLLLQCFAFLFFVFFYSKTPPPKKKMGRYFYSDEVLKEGELIKGIEDSYFLIAKKSLERFLSASVEERKQESHWQQAAEALKMHYYQVELGRIVKVLDKKTLASKLFQLYAPLKQCSNCLGAVVTESEHEDHDGMGSGYGHTCVRRKRWVRVYQ
jgi:hypothetical protein